MNLFNDLKQDIKQDLLKLKAGDEKKYQPAATSAPSAPSATSAPSPQKVPQQQIKPVTPAPSPSKIPVPAHGTPQQQQQQQTKPNAPAPTRSTPSQSSLHEPAKEKESSFGGVFNILSPMDLSRKKEASQSGEISGEKHQTGNLFSVDLLGMGKGKELTQQLEQENAHLKREIAERDLRLEALSENMKHMYIVQEGLEKHIEDLKNAKGTDSGNLLTFDRSQHLEETIKKNEQLTQKDEVIKQLKAENERLKSQLQPTKTTDEYLLSLQHQIEQVFREAGAHQESNEQAKAGHQGTLLDLDDSETMNQPLLDLGFEAKQHPPLNDDILLKLQTDVIKAILLHLPAHPPPQSDSLISFEAEEPKKPEYSEAFVENLKSQIEMWKDAAKKESEQVAKSEMAAAEKVASLQKMFQEDMIFKDNELSNLRKITMSKLDEKKVDYEPLYKQASDQLEKMSSNLQEVSTELSKALQENNNLQSKLSRFERDAKDFEGRQSNMSEQTSLFQKKIAGLEEELRQKNDQLTSLKANLETTRSTLNAVSTKANTLREEKKELNDRYVAAMEKLTDLEKSSGTRSKEFDLLVKEKDATLNLYHEEVSKREQLQKESQQQLEDLKKEYQQRLDDGASQVAAVVKEQEKLRKIIEEANSEITSLKEERSNLEANVAAEKEEIERLKAQHQQELEQEKNEILAVQQEVEALKQEIEAGKAKIAELEHQIEGFESEKKIAEKKNLQLIKDLKKQLALERARNGSTPAGKGGELNDSSSDQFGDISQMKEDLDSLVIKVTSLQSEIMDLKREKRALSENVEVLKADSEGKSKIIQDYLSREKTGRIAPASPRAPSSPITSTSAEDHHKSKLANLGHLSSNLTNLAHLPNKKKSGELDTAKEANRRLQDIVEENMMKNLQFQELIKNLSEENAKLRKEKDELEAQLGSRD